MSWFTRLRNAFRPEELERELDDEMRDHLERRIEELEKSGVGHAEAERRVKLRFGNSAKLREESRDARLLQFVDGTVQDVRYALRLMRKSPGFTATIVVSLGLAIGANTAVFSILDAALLRPLPVTEPDRLIAISMPSITEPGADPEPERPTFSYPQLRAFRAAAGNSARLGLFGVAGPADVQGFGSDALAERAVRQFVSGDAFEILGVTPALGRLIGPNDDRVPGAHSVVVLSYEYWRRRFDGDPGVLGRFITADGVRSEIIGVARPGFFGTEPGQMVQLWQPAMEYNKEAFENPGWAWFQIVGRLGAGVSPEQVAARLQPAMQQFNAARVKEFPTMPEAVRKQFLEAKVIVRRAPNGISRFRSSYETPLWVILGVALAILAIACSNVASLLLARAASRASEVAMRVSLGARRLRLIRQLLTESVLYAAAAGALGWMLAKAIAPLLVETLSTGLEDVQLVLPMNTTVLLFSMAVSLAAAVLFGLAPAWQASRSQPILAMRASSGQAGKLRLGRVFVSVQVAFAFGLVILGSAFLFSLRNLRHVDTGFQARGVTAYMILLPGDGKLSEEAGTPLTQQLRDRISALPGVVGTAGAGWAMFTGSGWTEQVIVPGRAPGEHEELFYPVTDGYFTTLGTRLLAGRDFERSDFRKGAGSPAIVNHAFAAKYFAGVDPIGQHFRYPSTKEPVVIVGVVGDTHFMDLRGGSPPMAYFPFKALSGWVYVRSTGRPLSISEIDAQARAVRPGMRVGGAFPLESLIGYTILKERLLAVTGGTLGGLGMVLAAIGLFGLLNYSVERRTREIGIRAALGARFGQIVGLVLRETVGMVAFGLVVGFAGAVLVLGTLEKLLFGIRPAEPAVAIVACVVFLVAALIAAGLPARRAAAVDPMSALRVE